MAIGSAAKRDYYEIIGVKRSATEKEIKKAYRRLAREHHPDLNPGSKEAERRFKEISEAYHVLSNAELRKKYDQLGHRAFEPGANAGGGFDATDFANFDMRDFNLQGRRLWGSVRKSFWAAARRPDAGERAGRGPPIHHGDQLRGCGAWGHCPYFRDA